MLRGAAGIDPTYTMDDLRREVLDGYATLYRVTLGADTLGYVVLWVDDFGRTKELVVQTGEAIRDHVYAARVALPVIEAKAGALGCSSMRVHVAGGSRFIRELKRFGFRKTESVLKKGLV